MIAMNKTEVAVGCKVLPLSEILIIFHLRRYFDLENNKIYFKFY